MTTLETISNNSTHDDRGPRQITIDTLLFRAYSAVETAHNINKKSAFNATIRAEKIAAAEMQANEWAQAAHCTCVDLGLDINRVVANFIEGRQRASKQKLAFLDPSSFEELGFSPKKAQKLADEGVPAGVAKNLEGLKEMQFSPTELASMFHQVLRNERAKTKARVQSGFALQSEFETLVESSEYYETFDLSETQEQAIIEGLARNQDFQMNTIKQGMIAGWNDNFLSPIRSQFYELKGLNQILEPRRTELTRITEEKEREGYTPTNNTH